LNALDAADEASVRSRHQPSCGLLQTVDYPEALDDLLPFPSVPHEFDVRDQILQWLAPNINQQRQLDLSQDRVPGTRKWLLVREDYQC
jgi:hypothetical protein